MALKCTCLLLLTLAVFGANCSSQGEGFGAENSRTSMGDTKTGRYQTYSQQSTHGQYQQNGQQTSGHYQPQNQKYTTGQPNPINGQQRPNGLNTHSSYMKPDGTTFVTPNAVTYMDKDTLIVDSNGAHNIGQIGGDIVYTPNGITYVAPDGKVTTRGVTRGGVNVVTSSGGNVLSVNGKTYVSDGGLIVESSRRSNSNGRNEYNVRLQSGYGGNEGSTHFRTASTGGITYDDGVVRSNGANVVSVNGKTYASNGGLTVLSSRRSGAADVNDRKRTTVRSDVGYSGNVGSTHYRTDSTGGITYDDGVDVVRSNGANVVSVNGNTYASNGGLNVLSSRRSGDADVNDRKRTTVRGDVGYSGNEGSTNYRTESSRGVRNDDRVDVVRSNGANFVSVSGGTYASNSGSRQPNNANVNNRERPTVRGDAGYSGNEGSTNYRTESSRGVRNDDRVDVVRSNGANFVSVSGGTYASNSGSRQPNNANVNNRERPTVRGDAGYSGNEGSTNYRTESSRGVRNDDRVDVVRSNGANFVSVSGGTYASNSGSRQPNNANVNNRERPTVRGDAGYGGNEGSTHYRTDSSRGVRIDDRVDVVRSNGANVVSVNGNTFVSHGGLDVAASSRSNIASYSVNGRVIPTATHDVRRDGSEFETRKKQTGDTTLDTKHK